MFRIMISILLTLGDQPAKAQLTVGEVFNFQVGDVFQNRWTFSNEFNSPPSSYTLDTVVAVTWSAGLDTVYYTIHRRTHQYSTSNSVLNLMYTDLDGLAGHWGGAGGGEYGCEPSPDTTGISLEFCGRMTWTKFSVEDTCFESPGYLSQLIEGCGGPYYWTMVSDNAGESFERKLIYFRKGEVECGEFHAIPTSVDEIISTSPMAYPNPTSGSIHFDRKYDLIEVLDVHGRCVMDMFGRDQADLAKLESGTYFLRVQFGGSILPVKRVVKL